MKVTQFSFGEGGSNESTPTPAPRPRTTRRASTRRSRPCITYKTTPETIAALFKLDELSGNIDPNARAPYQPAIVNRRIVR